VPRARRGRELKARSASCSRSRRSPSSRALARKQAGRLQLSRASPRRAHHGVRWISCSAKAVRPLMAVHRTSRSMPAAHPGRCATERRWPRHRVPLTATSSALILLLFFRSAGRRRLRSFCCVGYTGGHGASHRPARPSRFRVAWRATVRATAGLSFMSGQCGSPRSEIPAVAMYDRPLVGVYLLDGHPTLGVSRPRPPAACSHPKARGRTRSCGRGVLIEVEEHAPHAPRSSFHHAAGATDSDAVAPELLARSRNFAPAEPGTSSNRGSSGL